MVEPCRPQLPRPAAESPRPRDGAGEGTRRGRRFRTQLTTLLLGSLAASGAGCERESAASRYETVTGVVKVWHADVGELTIRATSATDGGDRDTTCIVTKDSEIYVNDRLTGPDAITTGDTVHVLGYRIAAARDDRMVVSTARLERALMAPTVPAFLLRPASQPAPTGAAP